MGLKVKGGFEQTLKVLNKYYRIDGRKNLTRASQRIVTELRNNTPVNTGELRDGWNYEITHEAGNMVSEIYNDAHTDETRGRTAPVAVLLEHGHGTGTGGYVPGTHFISNTLDWVHDETIDEIKAVIRDA